MKKSSVILFALTLALGLFMLTTSYAATGDMSDPQNPHNMSSSAAHGGPSSVVTDQICIFCHTPHASAPDSPLWNRPEPSPASFVLYGPPLLIKLNPGLTGYELNGTYPSGSSRMCLSCHDGVTAIGLLFGGDTIPMPSGSEFITNLSAIIELDKAHPISFNYNQDVIDNVLNPTYVLPSNPAIDTPLDAAGQMQCTTCHDPHTDTRSTTGAEALPFWRHTTVIGTTRYDDVCNACHVGTPGNPPHLP